MLFKHMVLDMFRGVGSWRGPQRNTALADLKEAGAHPVLPFISLSDLKNQTNSIVVCNTHFAILWLFQRSGTNLF